MLAPGTQRPDQDQIRTKVDPWTDECSFLFKSAARVFIAGVFCMNYNMKIIRTVWKDCPALGTYEWLFIQIPSLLLNKHIGFVIVGKNWNSMGLHSLLLHITWATDSRSALLSLLYWFSCWIDPPEKQEKRKQGKTFFLLNWWSFMILYPTLLLQVGAPECPMVNRPLEVSLLSYGSI